ncbi:MAG: hypothetical protein IPI66_05560 [Chitinophagaceae bacterium]|nr:hypothetical protein [Chitinophagaceae bacterium]MBL0055805.1 hypothetical protein [Chitinophagaceae bacterium]
MKRFKTIDAWISIILIGASGIWVSWTRSFEYLLISYFVVGGWQVISMIVHIAAGCFTEKGGARLVYHWISFISLITMPLGSFFLLLFTAPFMAFYYTWLCHHEVYVWMQRPLALLK